LLALVWGGSVYAWSSPIIIALAVAVPVVGTAFVVREQRVPEPVLPLNLLRDPVLVICSATLFFSTCAFFAAVVFLPLFLQLVRGDTGTSSGLLLLPMMLGTTLSATVSGRIISWSGRYKWCPVLGLAPMAVALSLFAQMGPATEPLTTALLMAVFGVGFGMVGEVMILAVQNAADMRDIGTATGMVNLFRALGGSVGVAVYGSIFNSQLRAWMSRLIPDDVLGAVNSGSLQSSPAVIHTLPDQVRDGLALATANALSPVFLTAAVLAAIALLIVSFLEERPLRTTSAHENRSPLSTAVPRAQVMQEER
jgi:Na+/melibiose symporter-like transporter